MATDPSRTPREKRDQDLRNGVLLGALATLLVGGGVLLGLRAPATTAVAPEPAEPVYRDGAPASIEDLPAPRRMVVLPGRLASDDARAVEIEALLRLHIALGLRDVHPGPVVLSWAPAGTGPLDEDLCAAPGELDPAFAPWLRSGERPDPLGRPSKPEDDLRVAVVVRLGDGGLQLTAQGCSARSDRYSQVVDGAVDRVDVHLGEVLTWLASRVGVPDARPFEETWRRLPAFGGPAGRAYGRALVGSLGGEVNPDLIEAAELGAEAAWLAAWLGPETQRLQGLERAAELRWSFTAAVEDAAWEQVRFGRVDLARAVLERLAPADERARPVELSLAAHLLDEGQPRETQRLLEQLPARWNRTTGAARLRSRLAVGLGESERAEGWLDAWIEADPEAAEAWLMRGDVLRRRGQQRAARKAWQAAGELDEDQYRRALAREAGAAIDRGEPQEFAAWVDDRDETLGPAPAWLIELDAWMAAQSGDLDRSADGYASLAEGSTDERLRLNACVAAVRAGRGSESPSCADPSGSPWQRSRVTLALKSREPGLLPGYPPILDREVEEALELAPRHPAAVHAAWAVLGPHASAEDRAALAARWRVAHGAGQPLPELRWVSDEDEVRGGARTPSP